MIWIIKAMLMCICSISISIHGVGTIEWAKTCNVYINLQMWFISISTVIFRITWISSILRQRNVQHYPTRITSIWFSLIARLWYRIGIHIVNVDIDGSATGHENNDNVMLPCWLHIRNHFRDEITRGQQGLYHSKPRMITPRVRWNHVISCSST